MVVFSQPDGSRLCEGADFSTKLQSKHRLQIYEKFSIETLRPLSCKTDVVGCPFLSLVWFSVKINFRCYL